MRRGFVVLLLAVACVFIATSAMAQVFSEALGNQVWDEYINRYMRVAKEKGAAAATARNQETQGLIAQQHAFQSWAELNTQAVKDIGAEKWNEISKAKMAELKAKVEELQAGSGKKAAGAAKEAAKKLPCSF